MNDRRRVGARATAVRHGAVVVAVDVVAVFAVAHVLRDDRVEALAVEASHAQVVIVGLRQAAVTNKRRVRAIVSRGWKDARERAETVIER